MAALDYLRRCAPLLLIAFCGLRLGALAADLGDLSVVEDHGGAVGRAREHFVDGLVAVEFVQGAGLKLGHHADHVEHFDEAAHLGG